MAAYVNFTKHFGENVNKFIYSFWVSNGSIRLKLSENERSSIINLTNDLEELLSGNKFIRDEE